MRSRLSSRKPFHTPRLYARARETQAAITHQFLPHIFNKLLKVKKYFHQSVNDISESLFIESVSLGDAKNV
jgi:hypothetical protein